ncbi:zinc finger mynd domain-containing protein [Moniliophthora roreri MCA 2997]|uniref:Zinc finger mynd domain-containing protein n=2 Tax=Moniliophthora roreri TaxID=221103 RepID=V2WYX2_MONRO|nr:zinc finger mynd domain-containing protein [Moniliophthora roreri MCA 2997]KAI3604511.1 zinc finger mynd domain-containing protein [Moniliophthora roreri]
MSATKPRFSLLEKSAKSGSQDALEQLGKMGSRSALDLLKTIPTFLHHLPVPVPDASLGTFAGTHPHILARIALVSLGEGFKKDRFMSQMMFSEAERCWPQIWAWVLFLYDSYLNPRSDSFSSTVPLDHMGNFCHALHFAIAKVLFAFSLSRNSFSIMKSTPNCTNVAASLFLLATRMPICHAPTTPIYLHTAICCYELFDNFLDRGRGMGICEAIDNAPVSFASDILHRLTDAISGDTDPVLLQLQMAMFLRCTHSTPHFNAAFLRCRSIYWICRVMKWIDQRRDQVRHNHPKTYSLVRSYFDCVVYFYRTFNQQGYPAVIEALKAGFLKSLVLSADFVDAELDGDANDYLQREQSVQMVLDDIARKSIYHSVCMVLPKALRDAEGLYKPGTVLDAYFPKFRETIQLRLKDRREWDRLGFNCCGNPKCPIPRSTPRESKDMRIAMFRCSGCAVLYYCSQECQRVSWKDHREFCWSKKHNQLYKDGEPQPEYLLTVRDRIYRDWLIRKHANSAHSALVSHQAQYRTKKRLPITEPVVSVLGYTGQSFLPFTIDTMPVALAKRYAPNEDWEELVDQARKNGKDLLVVARTAIAGYKHDYHWVGFSYQKED